MKATVQKWGNSLAIRIPKSVAQLSKLEQNSEVDLSLSKGSLVITRTRGVRSRRGKLPHYELKDLMRKVTRENFHGAVETGPPVGKEIW